MYMIQLEVWNGKLIEPFSFLRLYTTKVGIEITFALPLFLSAQTIKMWFLFMVQEKKKLK